VIAIPMIRASLCGSRTARLSVVLLAGLALATPGLVEGIGMMRTARHWLPFLGSPSVAVLALVGRFLPYALLACWLTLREIPPGHEEAARTLGADGTERALRVWGPQARRGILLGALLVFLLALRELDAIVLIQSQVFPLHLYDKIHFSRLADEANLALLYLGQLLIPALLAALVASRLASRHASRPPSAADPRAER
jgi:ABC-type Fe3+ transport system permease subunit